jgi:hypothetical protein
MYATVNDIFGSSLAQVGRYSSKVMTNAELPLQPEWFPAALDAAQAHYKRINVTRHT